MAKALVDLATGEVSPIISQLRRKGGGFYMGVQEAMLAIAANKEFSGAEHKVLLALLGVMDYGGHAVITQARLADLVGMSKVSVNTAVAKLVKAGVISKGDHNGVACYRINPEIAQKGKEGL